jgi:RimJ/RimL family protein N-acetyltransferase
VRLRLGTDAEIFRMYGGSRGDLHPMTEETAKLWVRRLFDQEYAWIIEAGSLIGQIRLDPIDLRERRASLRVGIDDKNLLGVGLGTEAIGLVLDYAFNVLKLHRISVRVIAYNLRAIRAYQKCGFLVEGKEREAAFVDGMWYDDVMMAILDREYCGASVSKVMRASLSLDAGRLNDLPPFLNLGLMKCSKRRGRLLFARRNVQSAFAQKTTDSRICQCLHG